MGCHGPVADREVTATVRRARRFPASVPRPGAVLVVLLGVQTREPAVVHRLLGAPGDGRDLPPRPADPPEELTKADFPSPSYTPYTFGLAVIARGTGLASHHRAPAGGLANLVLFLVGFELFVTALHPPATGSRSGRSSPPWSAGASSVAVERVAQPELDRLRVAVSVDLRDRAGVHRGLVGPALRRNGCEVVARDRRARRGRRRVDAPVHGGVDDGAVARPRRARGGVSTRPRRAAARRRRDRGRSFSFGRTTPSSTYGTPPTATRNRVCTNGCRCDSWQRFRGSTSSRVVSCATRRSARADAHRRGWSSTHTARSSTTRTSAGCCHSSCFPAHVGIGLLVTAWIEHRSRPRAPVVAWLGVSVAIGVVGISPGLPRLVPHVLLPGSLRRPPSLQAITEPYDDLSGALPRGSIVVAETVPFHVVAPAYGLGVVAPGTAGAVRRRSGPPASARTARSSTRNVRRRPARDRRGVRGRRGAVRFGRVPRDVRRW